MSRYSFFLLSKRTFLGIALAGALPVAAFAHTATSRPASAKSAINSPMGEQEHPGKGPMTGAALPGGNPRIKALQASLNRAEHAHLAVDGKMDRATQAALKRFQKMHGMKPTGRPNKATKKALGL